MITNYSYLLPDKKTKVIFSKNVLEHMFSFVQDKYHLSEAGGQLFSRNPDDANIIIDEITGPYLSDKRSRYNWIPDVTKMSSDREQLFDKGSYIIGLWHTHQELTPHPSQKDKVTCEKHLQLLDSVYRGFLLITMGNGSPNPVLSIEYLERKDYKLRPSAIIANKLL